MQKQFSGSGAKLFVYFKLNFHKKMKWENTFFVIILLTSSMTWFVDGDNFAKHHRKFAKQFIFVAEIVL